MIPGSLLIALTQSILAQFPGPEIHIAEIRIQLPPPPGHTDPSANLALQSPGQELDSILATERRKLEQWAGLKEPDSSRQAAETILKQLEPSPKTLAMQGMRFQLLPDFIPAAGFGTTPEWKRSKVLQELRNATVEQLWKVARTAAQQDRFRITDQALRAIVQRDLEQPEAWRLLGYVSTNQGWATPYAVAQMERGRVLHPSLGWMDKDWIEPLAQGQLPVGIDSRTKKVAWGPGAQANASHADWENAWEIVTEHFRIRSNVDFDQAVAFGRKLEAFYQFFFSQMADLIGPELPLAKRWRIKTLKPTASPVVHHVAYFAEKTQYVRELTPLEGESIAESIGYYRRPPQNASGRQRGGRGMSYFYHDKAGQLSVESTLFHEASHQLLFETAGRDRLDSNRGHYWLFEGLGTCFETVEVVDNREIRFGAPAGARMDVARQRILRDKVFTPYEVFEAYGQSGFNLPSKIHDHYAQTMALTLYFLCGSDARTRDIFLDYARDAYKGRQRGGRGLAARLGQEPNEIDEGLIRYLKQSDVPVSGK